MKKRILELFWLATFLAAILAAGPADPPGELARLFPELAGWQMPGKVETFLPQTLYEHINGAAENFLGYDFRELAVRNYVNDQKQTVSAEIYFHGSQDNAFGIYSSEKPLAGDYLRIGAQGYYEEGVLNFISDSYYVKLNGFDLGANGRQTLLDLARRIAAAIGGKSTMPETLAAFPAQGKIENSERYILHNFLGHDFLHSAFVADYDLQGQKFQLFIMPAGSEDEARAMLQKYAALDKGIPAPAVAPGALAIRDPYNGPVRLFWRGAFIWGAVGEAPAAAACLEAINEKLK